VTLARNAQKEFLIGQGSRSHATYRRPSYLLTYLLISGWLLVTNSFLKKTTYSTHFSILFCQCPS